MLVKELFLKFANKKTNVFKNYLKHYALFDDYEIEAYGEEKIKKATKKFLELASKRYDEFLIMQPETEEQVIFVLKEIETNMDMGKYLETFMCEKSQIFELANEEFSVWDDTHPRIEHYAYDFTEPQKVLGMEVYYSVSALNAVTAIFHELICHGLTTETSETRKNEIIESIQQGVKEAKEGNYVNAEDFFKQLQDEILENASEEEKAEILKERAEKEKNKNRDEVYLKVAMRYNHKKCISIIEKYYLNKIASGEVKID